MKKISNLLVESVDVKTLPANGLQLTVDATAQQLLSVAKILNVRAVDALHAKLWINPVSGGARVSGTLNAQIVQPCVVTLDPVIQKIDETLARTFIFGEEAAEAASAGTETFMDLKDDDLPDYLTGSDLDLSRLLIETMGLAINLYPRASGAEMSTEQKGDKSEDLSPFSKLKTLNIGK